jgi:hypothetical protein
MTAELSDDEDQMHMGRGAGGAGIDDEDEDLEMEMDPRRGGGDARQRGNMHGRPNGATGQRQHAQQRAPYDDDENF